LAFPVRGAFHFQGPHMPQCPGLAGAPRVVDCPQQVVVHSGDVSAAITDGGITEHTLKVEGIPDGCKVTDVNVFMAVQHDENDDLSAMVELVGPAVVETGHLFTGICDSTANIVTTLDDDQMSPIGSVCPPVGGRYATAPGGGLDTFDGLDPSGDWTLQLADLDPNGKTGELLNWSLEIRTAR